MFCAAATAKAAAFGIAPYTAVMLGVITGIGGGILRDVLAGEIPSVLRRDTKLYAVTAVAGCIVVSLAHVAGQDGVWYRHWPRRPSVHCGCWRSGGAGERAPAPKTRTN